MRCYKSDRERVYKLLLCHKRHLFAFNLFDDISICLLFRFILHCRLPGPPVRCHGFCCSLASISLNWLRPINFESLRAATEQTRCNNEACIQNGLLLTAFNCAFSLPSPTWTIAYEIYEVYWIVHMYTFTFTQIYSRKTESWITIKIYGCICMCSSEISRMPRFGSGYFYY